ncbi:MULTISPECIES: EndoU domain-containing protein [Bacillus cereus group]|uniref:EndoU domain-containing protein n=1 Tax=Bacillus cereus group TaxID=86661 RepID=UPI000BF280C2|nr:MULTISPECIES: EndoU domain-containing protein [Bacillus cereus group]MDA2026705.1 EndoU domain-containing protein [Bacillus cereus group sp. Bcc03]MDA2261324.1 EndoU domain-containing protein [Bacillus cereus group sp. Bc200]MDA2322009.1 EndoU domain-containing protein [Bacillus cereus group sp. Bc177]MDA2713404.1 EndoU domain-containing protein [Bacillus cereus group sp. Bc025]MEE3946213.1 EndoU domain-containing protein [Bacillus wiedmannii]
MSLNMYLGEVQSQTQSMNAVCTATIQGMEQAIQSIDAFAIDTVLQGQTYSSAKSFFVQTFRPLAQGIIYLCEELIRQNDAFPSQFQSKVASTDVIEQEIREQIQEINQSIASIEAVDVAMPMPGIDAIVAVLVAMRKKLEEKLEHLYEFNYTSSNNYSTALQLAASIATGLAEVQSGKGFSPASGTFSTQGLNMEWTTSIQAITKEKNRHSEESSIIKGSLFDKFKDTVGNNVEAMDQLYEKFIHQIENTPLIGQYYNYKKGQNEAVLDELKGILNTILHPIDSVEGAVYALSHIDETFAAVEQAISDSWNQDVVNGDWNSRAKWYGNVEMQVKLAIAELFVGTKGVDKVSTLGKTSKLSESVNFLQGTKNVITLDKYKQSVDMLNNILMPKNQFAFADTNALNLRSFDYTTFNKAKDTFLFFDKFKSHPNSIYKNNGSVEHIFHGNVNRRGEAGGFHHESMPSKGKIRSITEEPNEHGVYKAEVEVNGIPKEFESSFFPKDWNRVEVLQAVKEAYNNREYTGRGNRYIGRTSHGIEIMMFIDSRNRVISAFPLR